MARLTKKGTEIEFSGKNCWVGVDVHKASYAVSILSEEGLHKEFTSNANPKKLLLQLVAMGIVIKALAYESGPTGFSLAWACQDAHIKVVVAAPSRIPRPIAASGKTDRLDCMKLAEFLAKGMIKSIAIPTKEECHLRALERRRQQVVKAKRKVRQHIKALLLFHDIEEPKGLSNWGKAGLERLADLVLPENLRQTLDSYLTEHTFWVAELKTLRQLIAKAAINNNKQEVIACLQTVPGIGETIAHTFVAEIFDPKRFRRAEEICAYVGLAPIIRHSGSGKPSSRLGQSGQNYLRSILVEASWRLLAAENYYKEFYTKIRIRTGIPQKAITAVARKLLVLLWRIAVGCKAYRPVQV